MSEQAHIILIVCINACIYFTYTHVYGHTHICTHNVVGFVKYSQGIIRIYINV